MGGGADGEVASAATVKAVEDCARMMPQPFEGGYPAESVAERVANALSGASEWLWRRSKEKKIEGSGSTYVGVVFDPVSPGRAIAMHAGDSRLYRFRDGELIQVTRDHSAAELIGSSDEEINPLFRGMIMRAVGVHPKVEIERTLFPVAEGDRILICSDGLTRMVPDGGIADILSGRQDADDAVHALIDAANAAGGVDNVTVVVVDVGALPPPQSASHHRPAAQMRTEAFADTFSTNPQTATMTDDGDDDSSCFAESPDGIDDGGPSSEPGVLGRIVSGIFTRRKSR
jgi:protein phosphatase